jgi:benzil reductase ((S)-benzoin forming)
MDTIKAVLTGHSRGLGAAIAAELAAHGIPTLALARHSGVVTEGLAQVELDLSDTAALAAWLAGDQLETFLAGAGTVLLINNAGMLQPVGPIATHAPDQVARAIALNVAAPLMLAAAVAALPAADRRVRGCPARPFRHSRPPSPDSRCALLRSTHAARAAALDEAPGLRICSLAPGVIDTDMQGQIRASDLASFPLRERFEALKREGHLDTPADCARKLVRFVLSPDFGRQAVADLRDA